MGFQAETPVYADSGLMQLLGNLVADFNLKGPIFSLPFLLYRLMDLIKVCPFGSTGSIHDLRLLMGVIVGLLALSVRCVRLISGYHSSVIS